MRLLFDTHAYFWWVRAEPDLSSRAADALGEPASELYVSAVVAWELATKGRLGKWPGAVDAADDLDRVTRIAGLRPLPITLAHARRAGALPSPHRDPFDRMLAAQALLEDLVLVTRDPAFQTLSCRTLW